MSTALSIEKLSKRFGGSLALDGVSMAVSSGSIHALLGSNGSGKSTLIKVLAGVYSGEPGGAITIGGERIDSADNSPAWARRVGMSFVHQDLGLFDPLTVAENLFAGGEYPRRAGGIDWARMRRIAQEELDRRELEISADTLLEDLRVSEKTLVAVVRAMQGRDAFHGGLLVLDEPTARLPPEEVDFVLDALKRYAGQGQSILYVSHRLEEVMDAADEVTVLRDGMVIFTKPVAELTQTEMVTAIAGRKPTALKHQPQEAAAQTKTLLEVRSLGGGPLADVSLTVQAGEIVGIAGIVGSGRTSLLEKIIGALPRGADTVLLEERSLPRNDIATALKMGLAYVPEDRVLHAAFLDLTVAENLAVSDLRPVWNPLRSRERAERLPAEDLVGRFGIRTAGVDAQFSTLSGGNQQKVVIARMLARNPRVLLLDEPTQGVDVGAREDIYRQITQAVEGGGAAVLVSSDFEELEVLADRVVILRDGRLGEERRRGNFDRHWLTETVYGL